MMQDMRGVLIAFVQPPGVLWINREGSMSLSKIYTSAPDDYRYAVVQRGNSYDVIDFWEMTYDPIGWLIPTHIQHYPTGEAAVAATVLLNQ